MAGSGHDEAPTHEVLPSADVTRAELKEKTFKSLRWATLARVAGTESSPVDAFLVVFSLCWNGFVWLVIVGIISGWRKQRALQRGGQIVRGELVSCSGRNSSKGGYNITVEYRFNPPDGGAMISDKKTENRRDLRDQPVHDLAGIHDWRGPHIGDHRHRRRAHAHPRQGLGHDLGCRLHQAAMEGCRDRQHDGAPRAPASGQLDGTLDRGLVAGQDHLPAAKACALLDLLLAQFHQQRMYVSCTFYFEDLARPEPRYGIANGLRAIRLVAGATGDDHTAAFRNDLELAVSNKDGRTGGQILDEVMGWAGTEAAAPSW